MQHPLIFELVFQKLVTSAFISLLLLSTASATTNDDPVLSAINTGKHTSLVSLMTNTLVANELQATYLIASLKNKDTKTLQVLLSNGLDANAVNKRMQATAIMYAAYADRTDMMQVLFDHGADLNAADTVGDPAINWAVYGGKTKAVEWLLQRNVRLDQVGHGNAVQISKRRGFPVITQMLCAKQSCNQKTLSSSTQELIAAIDSNNPQIVKTLLNKEADAATLDETGRPLLHRAARQGRLDIVGMMLQHKVDINLQDDIGFTSLMEASRNGHREMVTFLLEQGADPNIVSHQSSLEFSAIHLAGISGDISIIEKLNEYQINLNAQDRDGTTAMLWAIYEGHKAAARKMIALGANGNLKSKHGDTAIAALAR